MSPRLRNVFLAIGVLAVVVMLCTFDMSYTELWNNIRRGGGWFLAVLALWFPIYLLNTWAWHVIIADGRAPRVSFWRVYKYTVSGYALNYVTPVGLLGGEPYRIMELTPYLGAAKATSSVILYAMMHIFSHFCFWAFSVLLYLLLYGADMGSGMAVLMAVFTAFCLLGIYFFMQGYRNGLVLKLLGGLGRLPGTPGRRIREFRDAHSATLHRVDAQIAELHAGHKRTFYSSLTLEFLARLLGCLEIQFILFILTDDVSFWDCVLIQAFTSLFANLFFFIPMEMGAREGGFALAVGGLALSGAYGVYTALIMRVREIVWIAVGLALLKVGNRQPGGNCKEPIR
ncbi:MAG: flippase-like domain-containing protein [Clostridium sp.]|nr:flippase-like domain-containing protein [Clostridium sp.]